MSQVGREEFEQTMRNVVGASAWDGLQQADREQVAEDYLTALSQPSPILAGPDRYDLLDTFSSPDLGDPNLGDAFRGYLVHDGLTSRAIWNVDRAMNSFGWYRGLTNGVDQPMQQFVPGNGLIDYTPDAYFSDLAKKPNRTPAEDKLIDGWVVGDFDSVVDSTHLAALVGFHVEEQRLSEELSKLSTAQNLAFGLPVAFMDPIAIMGGLKAFHVATRGMTAAKAATIGGRIATNIGEGLAISAVAETGLAALSDRDPEQMLTNIAAGAAFDAVAGGVWEALFRRAGRANPADLSERAGTVHAVEQVVANDVPPAAVVEALQQKADGFAERQASEEFKSKLDFVKYRYIPSYKDRGGTIRILANTVDYEAIADPTKHRWTGFIVVNNETNRAERFLSWDEFKAIREEEAAAREKILADRVAAEKAANRIPITTGENAPIDPALTLDDFAQVETRSGKLTQTVVGAQTGRLSNYGLERSPNKALQLVITRTFDRIRTIKGWTNGKVQGFASFETRRKQHQAQQTRTRSLIEKRLRTMLASTSTPFEKGVLKLDGLMGFSNELLPVSILHKRQLLLELLELERLSTHGKMLDDNPEAAMNALEQRITTIREELRAAGMTDIDVDSPLFGAPNEEFTRILDMYLNEQAGKQIHAARLSVLNRYARIRLNPEDISFDGVVNLLREMRDSPKASPEALLADAIENKKRLHADDLLPENRNSPQTLQRLTQYFNEDIGGYVHSKHVPALLQHVPSARLSTMVSLDSFFEFIDIIEAHATYSYALREMAQADVRFRDREDVQKLIAKVGQGYDRFLDPEVWEHGTPPFGTIKREVQDILRALEDHTTKEATVIRNNPGGVEHVKKTFDYIREKLGLKSQGVSDFERKVTDIAGNTTRSVLLTMGGVSQIGDTATMLNIAALNGVQGGLRSMLRGMMIKWNQMADTPAMRNALFRGLALTGETNLSFATQRFSAADYELRSSAIGENIDGLGRARGITEAASAVVSKLSMTDAMNLMNKGGALMGSLHELTDPEFGVIPKLKAALDKADAAASTDLVPFFAAEGVKPELAELVLRTLDRSDLTALTKKIKAGEFEEVKLKKRFGFIGGSETTVRLVANPENPKEAIAIEKLAHTVNYLVDRKVAVPGFTESSLRTHGFGQEMIATFLRQPMAIATRILIGSSYSGSLERFSLLMTLLGGATMVGFAKALLSGKEREYMETLTMHPARFVADRLAWSGAFGILGEKMMGFMLDATSPQAYKRMNAGEFQTLFPLQGVVQTYAKGFGGVANAIFSGYELNSQHVNALWRMTILGETTIAKGIQRVFNVMREEGDEFEAKRYFTDAVDLMVGVKEGNPSK